MNSQSINDEDMANVVGRLAVEGAGARAHKLLGKIHVEVLLEAAIHRLDIDSRKFYENS